MMIEIDSFGSFTSSHGKENSSSLNMFSYTTTWRRWVSKCKKNKVCMNNTAYPDIARSSKMLQREGGFHSIARFDKQQFGALQLFQQMVFFPHVQHEFHVFIAWEESDHSIGYRFANVDQYSAVTCRHLYFAYPSIER